MGSEIHGNFSLIQAVLQVTWKQILHVDLAFADKTFSTCSAGPACGKSRSWFPHTFRLPLKPVKSQGDVWGNSMSNNRALFQEHLFPVKYCFM